jgi:ABC-type Fe3+/spermidine/putrescine transport system ATPase subunit
MVTHDLEDVFEMSDRCIVMKKAEIEQQGYLRELYNMPKNSYVAELFGEVLVVNDKKYRPENIKIYKTNTNDALQCMILNVKFNKNYNELTIFSGRYFLSFTTNTSPNNSAT